MGSDPIAAWTAEIAPLTSEFPVFWSELIRVATPRVLSNFPQL